MTDLALQQDPETGRWDLAMAGPDLATEDGLKSAVIWSLITDKRAEADDEIPDGTDNRRGFWGDPWSDIPDHQLGSRDWIVLNRAKQTQETLNDAIDSAKDALQWLIDQGVASAVDVSADWVRTGMIGRTITITRPNGIQSTIRYESLWRSI